MNSQHSTAYELVAASSIKDRQAALIEIYKDDPASSIVTDKARTCSKPSDVNNPMAAKLILDKNDQTLRVGVDFAVGGDSKNPTPGDILCGALAACLDTSIRLIANRLNLRLSMLAIEVEGKVDVKGALQVDRSTPVAFQSFDVYIDIQMEERKDDAKLDMVLRAAESSCVVMQSLLPACKIVTHRKPLHSLRTGLV